MTMMMIVYPVSCTKPFLDMYILYAIAPKARIATSPVGVMYS